jgi:hypothetical protein
VSQSSRISFLWYQYSWGFESQTGEYGNLVAKGIVDPTKVVRVAIRMRLRLPRC